MNGKEFGKDFNIHLNSITFPLHITSFYVNVCVSRSCRYYLPFYFIHLPTRLSQIETEDIGGHLNVNGVINCKADS